MHMEPLPQSIRRGPVEARSIKAYSTFLIKRNTTELLRYKIINTLNLFKTSRIVNMNNVRVAIEFEETVP